MVWYLQPEMESRTQGSRPRPRTQKKSEAKAKGSLSENRPLEAKAKDQGHKRKCSPKKKVFTKNSSQKFTKQRSSQKILHKNSQNKGLHKNISGDLQKIKTSSKDFSGAPQNFNNSKNSAVLEPRTGQFSRT